MVVVDAADPDDLRYQHGGRMSDKPTLLVAVIPPNAPSGIECRLIEALDMVCGDDWLLEEAFEPHGGDWQEIAADLVQCIVRGDRSCGD